MTIFLSSHLLAEVEELCTRVSVIRQGRIVYEGALADLHAQAAPRVRLRTDDQGAARRVLAETEGVQEVTADGGALVFTAPEDVVLGVSRRLVHAGLGIAELARETATLEQLFFELTESADEPRVLEAVA
jgi:ABC-2 type transport system ATP-binding protein